MTTARRGAAAPNRRARPSTRKPRASASEGTTARPEPELTIVETRVYRGPNYWNYEPAIKLIVDLGVLEQFP